MTSATPSSTKKRRKGRGGGRGDKGGGNPKVAEATLIHIRRTLEQFRNSNDSVVLRNGRDYAVNYVSGLVIWLKLRQSTSKTTGNSSKKDNLSMSNSFSALNEEEEEDVENVYDESANLIQNTKAGGSSSFTAAAG
ncbi:hypothetical protein Tco_0191469 [Tanacetum coccineum]